MVRSASRRVVALSASIIVLVTMIPVAGGADHTADPSSAALAGSFQQELGCTDDWQPECAATELTYDTADEVWQETYTVPAGSWEYKVALDDAWTEAHPADNRPLTLGAETAVKFYYSHDTHWVADTVNDRIVTAAGDFQDEIGCPGEWQPDCLRSWLQDPDGDGVFTFATDAIPAGDYQSKAAIGEGWAESYPAANLEFSVADGDIVTFSFDSPTNTYTVEAAPPVPPTVTAAVAGSFQDEVGCPGDWQPECATTEMTNVVGDVYKVTLPIPAGTWEYKVALDDGWAEAYPADNRSLALSAPADVSFYFSLGTTWVADNVNERIVTAPGSHQSELGCSDDWQPDCLLSWLQDLDDDDTYSLTVELPAGDYLAKAAIGESWDENYGAGGVANGDDIAFTVPAGGGAVSFDFESASNIMTVAVGGGNDDAELIEIPVRPSSDEVVYFLLTDRFDDGDPANNTAGDTSGDPLAHGFKLDDKGYYHGGDIAGLAANLDYLESLGVTAIWITPPFVNRWVQGDGTIEGSSAGYHGYWQTDFTQIDPHLGTNAEMQAFIADAQSRGIKVLFDVVVNHTGDVITNDEGVFAYRNKTDYPYLDATGTAFDDAAFANQADFPALDAATSFPYTPTFADPADADIKAPDWLDDPTYYHNRGDSTFSGESSLYGDFFGLDDLFTEHPDVVDGMVDIAKSFIDTFGVDGFRVDTVKHVNDEFWAEWVPEVLDHAAAQGKAEFVVFGEVFGESAEYRSRYSTELAFPGTLDFGFDGAASNFAADSGATDGLRDHFAEDDWYTDMDSNAHFLATFIGNHDVGRFGKRVDDANPGASDAERVDRVMLGQALNLFTRGHAVVYYGDEQGFTGDGGDKDARQDMFPSEVATYNDDDLIGTSATTADDNFDTTHPLFREIADLTAVRGAHPALTTGAQLHRYSEATAGIYAFSRIDRDERVEYLVALNNSESTDSATFPTATSGGWGLVIGEGTISPSTGTDVTVELPALSYAVFMADTTITTDSTLSVSLTNPADGADVSGRVEVRADVVGGHAEVTFVASVGDGPYEPIGVDDNAPYRVFYDVSGLADGTTVSFKAVAADFGGNVASAETTVTVSDSTPPDPGGDARYAIVHYLRADGDYGDHTTGDFNDFWGLHLWGGAIDSEEVTVWQEPKPFLGEDDYGRFAWIELEDPSQPVNFIVHRGDTKDGTDADRFFDPAATPEIWLRQDDPNNYTNQAEAQGFVTIHYHRDDGDYGDPTSSDFNDYWGLHLWGDALAAGVGTSWDGARPFDGVDDFGAFWQIPIENANQPLNYIIHRGDEKDPGPDQSFIPAEQAAIWQNSGDETQHPAEAAATNTATIHYHRPAGDYGDYTSTNFADFWGMHTWTGAAEPNPSWQEPVKPIDFDIFGPVFAVPLVDGATELAYILHRGDEKDPGPDQFLDLATYGHEVWQLQGADPEAPYILPIISGGGVTSRDNLATQQAYWIDANTIIWPAAQSTTADYQLCWSASAALEATTAGVDAPDAECVELTPSGTYQDPDRERDGFFHLVDQPILTVPSALISPQPGEPSVDDVLDAQHAVVSAEAGVRLDATGIQIPGVLDDLYATDVDLGVHWDGEAPTISVWAPTAQDVDLHLFADSEPTSASVVLDMNEVDGVWSVEGAESWEGAYYLFEVTVYAPSTGDIETNLVTDPYSLSLSVNSARSQIVDLASTDLEPDGWHSVTKPELVNPEDITVYEMHIRDFSVNDPSVPDGYKGTYKAFTLDGTHGIAHLEALTDAGLSHLHLLPAFDIATIDEDRSSWQSPDFDDLRLMDPASEDQQAAVTATEDLDGFNWGYDPWHYTTPEGSYATNPDGATRVVEFREMVQSINDMGLRVVMDVVYNHTNASGQAEKSVLDRVVPGYYHRLDDKGTVEKSTCCENTATEHAMMEKLMIDSVITWATAYKVDAFRFDLMGHHSKQNMLDLRAALDALTPAEHGVDGSEVYLYGEGWNFGEVANDARFVQATQANMAGTGIGTFSDRLRDAVRGGSPFDGGEDLIRQQGVINGLFYDPNELNSGSEQEKAELLLSLDQIRVGLAGNLAAYQFTDRNGDVVTGADVDYNGSPAGYTADPQEHIVYVSKHDNQTLFDISQYRHPENTSLADRVRAQNLGMDFTVLAQGVPFLHAGVDTLRSKSLDRDSFNSGDWFNRLDWTYQENGWASGLPVASKNQDNWPIMKPLLEGLESPDQGDIESTVGHLREMLSIRADSPLFRLETLEQVQARVGFHNTGPNQIPGLVVMTLDDTIDEDIDAKYEKIVVLFNASNEAASFTLADEAGAEYELHPIQQASPDGVVQEAGFDLATGTFTVPARTTAVFVTDVTPPAVEASLDKLFGGRRVGWYEVGATCSDADPDVTLAADINGVSVEDGGRVLLITHRRRTGSIVGRWFTIIWGPDFDLTVTCSDSSGNTTVVVVGPGESGTGAIIE